ncbi:uncharacterized protein LOC119456368 isoform X3 [Dermacentor silvarum]|uniref:uncharacterized protein LOC119456368 isoform X2 n=1 Tax=Dermacentor silvarum TaxID=543639 RepID=UPI00210183F1|nr:uncharacterized protein LOC119456368 isoform X2 [Dermacentor silvarum]XP_049525751.1 uncharacterized protein LOC119456368 isoform X3 [Dermacentor silvarum]
MVTALHYYRIPTFAFDCGPRVARISSVLLHVCHPPNVLPREMALSTTRTVAGRVGSIAFYHPWRPAGRRDLVWSPATILNLDLCFRLRPTSRMSIVLLHVCHPPNVPIQEMALSTTCTVADRAPSSVCGLAGRRRLLIILHHYVIPTPTVDCCLRVGRTSVCRSLPSSQRPPPGYGLEHHSHRGRPCSLHCIPSPIVSCRQTELAPTTDVRFRWRCTRTI